MTASATPMAGPARRSAPREFLAAVATIMVKELRSRFRGRRAFLILTIYLGVLALIAYGGYAVVAPSAREQAQFGGFDGFFGPANLNASATIGQAIFALLSVFQLLLVCFIAPAMTAGAISLEREKQTLDLLVTTPMRPGAIVIGKLFSAMAFVALMIVAAIPLSALVLMYGGASVEDILRQQVVLFTTAAGFGVIGLFYSALVKRTQAATVLTYCTVLALAIGTLLIWRFWTVVATNVDDNPLGQPRPAPEQLLWVNPAVAMIELVANTEIEYGDFARVMQHLRTGIEVETTEPLASELVPRGGPFGDEPIFRGPDLAVAPPGTVVSNHFWPRFALTFSGLAALLTVASMFLVVPAGLRWRLRRGVRRAPPQVEPDLFADAIEETIE